MTLPHPTSPRLNATALGTPPTSLARHGAGADAASDEYVFNLVGVGELLTFPFRSVKRHRVVAVATFASVAGAAFLAALLLPRHYIVEAKLIADRNDVMPALGNPTRAAAAGSDAPTRLAAEAVMKRDNLVSIVKDTHLLERWAQIRSPLGKLKDFAAAAMNRPISDAERMTATVGLLSERLWVRSADGTVTIGVDWSEPQTAYELVRAAQDNFVEQRRVTELQMIDESIKIINDHVRTAQQTMEAALALLKEARPDLALPAVSRAPRAARATAPEVASLQSALTTKQRAIADLEAARSQRLVTLQTRLAELRHAYGPAHPDVAATQESIQAMSAEPAELVDLRRDERSIRARLATLGGDSAASGAAEFEPALARAALDRLSQLRRDSSDNPQVVYAQSRLKMATADYEELQRRLGSANIELETTRAAFKYRFNVVTPPEVPRRALKPNVPVLILGGLMLGLLLSVVVSVALDLASGRILESWQVARQLQLPLLATVRHS